VKTDKTGLVRFCRFIENKPIEFEIFKILRKFEIKILKNYLHFKNFGQNRIQKFVVFHRRKIEARSAGVKIEKNPFNPGAQWSYPLCPCLFPTCSPPSHHRQRGIARSTFQFAGRRFLVQIDRLISLPVWFQSRRFSISDGR
jgi:hypothetical protein